MLLLRGATVCLTCLAARSPHSRQVSMPNRLRAVENGALHIRHKAIVVLLLNLEHLGWCTQARRIPSLNVYYITLWYTLSSREGLTRTCYTLILYCYEKRGFVTFVMLARNKRKIGWSLSGAWVLFIYVIVLLYCYVILGLHGSVGGIFGFGRLLVHESLFAL